MMKRRELLWGVLVHLGTNLWFEEGNDREADAERKVYKIGASSRLRFDMGTWDRLLTYFKEKGVNTILLDLAEGMQYESHPELAVEGSLSREEMVRQIKRMREMGFEIIPKLNFSTTHDVWLKDYARMVSTDVYYRVCEDLIREVCELFQPRYLHIGFDEEGLDCQKSYDYIVIRNNDLWFHDLRFFADCVERCGARAMMWSDYARHRPEEFIEKCPRSIVQCVWYYNSEYEGELSEYNRIRVMPFKALGDAGFDLFPIGSIEYQRDCLEKMVKYCMKTVASDQLIGFGTTTWEPTVPAWEDYLKVAGDTVGECLAMLDNA